MTAKTTKHGLGRGLDALLGNTDEPAVAAPAEAPGDRVLMLKLTEIDPNRAQPRHTFDEAALSDLAASIAAVGIIQPILVTPQSGRYQIVAGERRWRAARMAGLTEIPAIVREVGELRKLEIALIENLQRDDLSPVEEARGVRELMDKYGYTQEAAAKRLGKSRPAIANLLRILSLDERVMELVSAGRLSAGHARALAGLDDAQAQLRLANLAVAQGWSVRQLEKVCQQAIAGAPERTAKPARLPEFRQLERMAQGVFGTQVRLEGDQDKGKLVLKYYSAEDLQRIWDVLECLGQNQL